MSTVGELLDGANDSSLHGVVAAKGRGKRRTETKDDDVRFRASATEKEAFKRAAVADGRTLSGWLRHVALKAAGIVGSEK